MKSGTIYPALHRLESEGWLRSWSEPVDSSEVGRPARRLYALTPTGLAAAEGALAPFREVAPPRRAGDPGAEVGVSSAIEILGAVVLVAGALVLLALLRGIHDAAVPSRLVERALEQLPPELRVRYGEEWRADLAALSDNAARSDPVGAGPSPRLQRAGKAGGNPARSITHLAGDPRVLAAAGARRRPPSASPTSPPTRSASGATCPRGTSRCSSARFPFAIVGGLMCLALVGAYAPATSRRLVKVPEGVGLVTLALVAYVALIQPVLILRWDGFVAVKVPWSVYVIFGLSACALMALSRAAIALTRVART